MIWGVIVGAVVGGLVSGWLVWRKLNRDLVAWRIGDY